MIFNEKKYEEQEYEGFVRQLLQSENIDEELQHARRYVLRLNPRFFLLMFRTVGSLKKAANSANETDNAEALQNLEAKLYEHTNIIPADLPDSILLDRDLLNIYLENDSGVHFVEDKWRDFQRKITNICNEIPNNLELPFLEWCHKMLKTNYARHIKICKDPTNCGINQGYDKRINYLTRLMEEATPIPAEPFFEIAAPQFRGNKIQWLGSQKELAELFVELKKKGWIEKFENEAIQDCFTESNSVPHYLKPGTDTKTGEHTFENLYTGYSPQFYGIKENPKRRK